MEIDSALLSLEDNIKNAEAVKQLVLTRLCSDAVITEEQMNVYLQDWQIIVFKKGWFRAWCDKYCKGKNSEWAYKFVKFNQID